jgi:hypothetical protein
MEQNLVGFPNSMFPHVGPYTPYFGYDYNGIRSVPTTWPPMFDPFVNITTPPKLVSRVAQARTVIDHGSLWMVIMIFPKGSTTLGCHK